MSFLDQSVGMPRNFTQLLERGYCLKRIDGRCIRKVRVREVEEGLWVELVEERGDLARDRAPAALTTPVALMPRAAVAVDPFFGEAYVAHKGRLLAERIVAVWPADDWDGFIREATRRPPYHITGDPRLLDAIRLALPRMNMTVSVGLTDNGIADPLGVLDTNDYGIEPLLEAYRWARAAYGGADAAAAWFNVMAVLAKLMTPMLRVDGGFIDDVVYNVVDYEPALAHVLVRMLGQALEGYRVYLRGAADGDAARILTLNRLPLILSYTAGNHTAAAPASIAAIMLSSIHGVAGFRGGGLALRAVRNLRGVVAFTDVPLSQFLRAARADGLGFIELMWSGEPARRGAGMPNVKPVFGYAARLWRNHRDELSRARNLPELVLRLADAMESEHKDDAEAAEIAEYARHAVELFGRGP
jgi:hypothetical protein